jgi:hypothetical protein
MNQLSLSETDQGALVDLKSRIGLISEVYRDVLNENQHYGKVPGTNKPTLFKAGAEKIACLLGLETAIFVDTNPLGGDHREYIVKCTISRAGVQIGEGVGSCSTMESKYRYRWAKRVCPECKADAIMDSKFDDGYYCNKKAGGCGRKFSSGSKAIEEQVGGKIENPDLADVWNTVLKMADKRAFVAAILKVAGVSDIFTQDLEDAQPVQSNAAQPVQPKSSESKPKQNGLSNTRLCQEVTYSDLGKELSEKVWSEIIGDATAANYPITYDGLERYADVLEELEDGVAAKVSECLDRVQGGE